MLAHALTTLRLLLALPTALAFAAPHAFPAWVPLAFMLTAIATDVLDGKVARAQGTASAAGQFFDHFTDCLFVTSALGGAAYFGGLTPWLPPLVLVAFMQYVLDSRLLHRQKQLRMSALGRSNGILYFVPALLLALATFVAGSGDADGFAPGRYAYVVALLSRLAEWTAWILVVSTLLSIVDRALARPTVSH